MTDVQERRDPATERVKVATLVEICGNIPGIPVFEAESVDVSARGMHLRTAYLPEAGAPLVCRFESEGREIVVEGKVAWRREGGRGGEFGVTFTALDSRSVDTLRGLCSPAPAADDKPQSQLNEPGARVRLHIEGLGSPMKARVKTGASSAKLQVGSSLEFLKVGKRLEIEDLDLGARRPAEIDTVSVVIDPSTQVPQLVVGLRFEGAEESTPSPSVAPVGRSSTEREAPGLRIPASRVSTDAAPSRAQTSAARSENESESDSDDEADSDEPEMRGRVATIAASAEQKAKVASERLAVASSAAARGAAGWLKSAAEKVLELKQRKAAPPRRTTSPAKSALGAEKPRLRPQTSAATASESEPAQRVSRRTLGVAGGASLIAIAAVAFALRGPSSAPPGAKAGAQSSEVVTDGNGAVLAPGAALSPGNVAAANPTAPSLSPKGAVTANVPLFGPTPLTTTEPAPLGPPPGTEAAGLEASEKADARASLAPRAADQAFPEEAEEGPSRDSERESTGGKKPEDVAPWGHGRLHEPIIHRLRLDGPGAKLSGTVDTTGFTVVVPERKVMEAPGGIVKRDPRIARIRAVNTPNGAQISFRFKDSVPTYRVRLRRDYVEFLISEPSKEAARGSKNGRDSKAVTRGEPSKKR